MKEKEECYISLVTYYNRFGDNESIDVFDEERDVMFAHEVLPQPTDAPPLAYCAVYNRYT